MEPIPLEELALLEVLQRVDQHVPLQAGDTEIHARLIESGLVADGEFGPTLTSAGIELCKSLHHRVAADAQAVKIVKQRENAAEASDGGQTSVAAHT